MSVKASAAVWDMDLSPTEKLVALAYADHADHDGRNIYPAVSTIMRKTGLKERSVRAATKRLIERGIFVRMGAGPHGTNRLMIDMQGCTTCTPPLHHVHPRGAPHAPNPSVTVNEPSIGADAPSAPQPPPAEAQTIPLDVMEEKPNTTTTMTSVTHKDGAADFFERAVAAQADKVARLIRGWKGDEAAKDMCVAFAQIFGAEVHGHHRSAWLKEAQRLVTMGVTRNEIAAAHAEVVAAGGALSRPGALENWVLNIRQKVRRGQALPAVATRQPLIPGRFVAVPAPVVEDDDDN